MEAESTAPQPFSEEIYNYAANMLIYGGMTAAEVRTGLVERGVDKHSADAIITEVQGLLVITRKKKAKKQMLYGALWFIAGVALVTAQLGYLFWGLIIFGAVQFFRGFSDFNR